MASLIQISVSTQGARVFASFSMGTDGGPSHILNTFPFTSASEAYQYIAALKLGVERSKGVVKFRLSGDSVAVQAIEQLYNQWRV